MEAESNTTQILKVGTVLVPKPEHVHRFKKGKEYIITQKDIDVGGIEIGEYWMVKP